MATKRKYQRKTCRDCGGRDEVIDGLCVDCEENYVYCSICEEWLSRDDGECRHVFWTSWGEYGGAGSNESEPAALKDAFFVFLDRLARIDPNGKLWTEGESILDVMERVIHEDRFWTFLSGPLLGCPTVQFLEKIIPEPPDGFAKARIFAYIYGGDFESDEEDEGEDEGDDAIFRDGFGWLQSLCEVDTKDANRLTVAWIAEWKAARSTLASQGVA